MNVLFVGDIVGPEATGYVVQRLPGLRREHAIDLVVANAENCLVSGPSPWTGFGMSVTLVQQLLASGVDVVTSGNHAWDGPEAEHVLAHPRVLRPHNLPPGRPGKGSLTLEIAGEPVTVLNLADALAIPNALPPYPSWLDTEAEGTVIVDFHGASSLDKEAFAHAVDGRVAAVLGTHTHEATLRLHRLPGGTGLVVDVGMTGPVGGVGGMAAEYFVALAEGRDTATSPFALATGPMVLGAVLLRLEGGRTAELTRLG